METITITKRIINGKIVCNKRFDNYEAKSLYGKRISYEEYKVSADLAYTKQIGKTFKSKALNIIERITYEN